MGLDVYLYYAPCWEAVELSEEGFNNTVEEIYGQEENRDAAYQQCKDLEEEMGLQNGTHPDRESIEIDSTLYPDHMFKIGYFRSSYNNGGLNNVLRNMGVTNLYDIFLPANEYEFIPDWSACLNRVQEAIRQFDSKVREGVYGASFVTIYDVNDVSSEEDAIALFVKHRDNHESCGFRSYSCRDGAFRLDGEEIVALIPGKNIIGSIGVYAVWERNRENLEWYRHSLEIVQETIEWVLNRDNPQNYKLAWSS
jgi:hypothetical protein